MRLLKMAAILLVLVALAVSAVVLTGAYSFAADEPHWGATEALISLARHRSVNVRVESISVPADLGSLSRQRRGAEHYEAMCVGCHRAPGRADSEMRQGLYPQPPDFTEENGAHRPASAFWVIKHGLKMSGMPAWGQTHNDRALWDLVALLRVLPTLTAEEYEALRPAPDSPGPAATGHHGGHGHAH